MILHESDIILVVTFNDSILSNAVLHKPPISSCTSEKADQHIICHAINLADKGYHHIQICSAGTDVIILSIAQNENIFSEGVNVLNVNCGSRKFYSAKSPFFHAFTGCNTVSNFYNHGKYKFFDTWMELNKLNGELTELFKSLSSMPDQIKSTDVDLLRSFLMEVYQQNSKRDISLDIFRMNQLSKCTSFNPHNLILSQKGFLEHTKRAALQVGWV